jgi:hypothetical protein
MDATNGYHGGGTVKDWITGGYSEADCLWRTSLLSIALTESDGAFDLALAAAKAAYAAQPAAPEDGGAPADPLPDGLAEAVEHHQHYAPPGGLVLRGGPWADEEVPPAVRRLAAAGEVELVPAGSAAADNEVALAAACLSLVTAPLAPVEPLVPPALADALNLIDAQILRVRDELRRDRTLSRLPYPDPFLRS